MKYLYFKQNRKWYSRFCEVMSADDIWGWDSFRDNLQLTHDKWSGRLGKEGGERGRKKGRALLSLLPLGWWHQQREKSTGSVPLRFALPTIWRWLLRIVNAWGPWSPWFKNQKQKHWVNLTIWFLLLIMVVVMVVIMNIYYISTYYVPVTFQRALHI